MKYLIIVMIFLNINLFALDLENKNITYLFKNHYFSFICKYRWRYINKFLGKREDLLSLVGYSCLKKHQLIPALDVAKALRFTKMGRVNANYIATLFNIKTLLIRYIEDKISLNNVNLPYVLDDDLGKIFYLIKNQKPLIKDNIVYIKTKKEEIEVSYNMKNNNIIIKFYKDSKLIKKDMYW